MSKLYSQLNDLTSQIENLEDENEKLKSNTNLHFAKNFELQKENKELKERISKLVSENTTLQNDLFSEQLLQDETDDYIDKLKNEIIDLKTEIVDRRIKEYRLLKILKETSD